MCGSVRGMRHEPHPTRCLRKRGIWASRGNGSCYKRAVRHPCPLSIGILTVRRFVGGAVSSARPDTTYYASVACGSKLSMAIQHSLTINHLPVPAVTSITLNPSKLDSVE
jgi:hypothetical protein